MKSVQYILALAAVAWAVAGCGQKGPLYMPDQPSQPVQVAPPPVLQTPPALPTTSQ
ncbi:LPS translocon maturation chaperone LptM [Noviherbaspirillum sp. Root189]|uniref:LPS translocon maturation chaperone LptM n=1 Tax=Noviherbaspirillum sp. Root189 TaxID=1736487 RepID=UPI000A538E0B|nr:lipoprotein [Noviherbaspirillum sp. Root189]